MKKIKIFQNVLIVSICILISCGKDLSISPDETFIKKNAVFIESNPSGAKIYINNKNTGQITPDTIYWVPSGEFILSLKLDLYKDTSVAVFIKEGDTLSLFIDYTKNKSMLGRLNVKSNPSGAEIILNDERTHKITPHLFESLVPGIYNVKLKLSGYWNEEKTDIVKSGMTTYIEPQFIDTLTWIHYTSARTGLPTDYITDVVIEKGTIKWIGTYNAGLISYDDWKWTVYDKGNSIMPDNKINSLSLDDLGNLWVCTNFGVVKKDYADNWTLYSSQNSGLPDNNITSASSNGQEICFGTLNKGIFIFNGATWVNYETLNSPLPSNNVNKVLYHNECLWVLTYSGLAKKNDTSWVIMNDSSSGFPSNNCKSMAFDKTGKTWIVFITKGNDSGGSGILWNDTFISFPNLPSNDVSSVAVEPNNDVWFGNFENGLSKYNVDIWENYRKSNSRIGCDIIMGIAIDGNGTKWLASYGKGLIKYKGN